MPSRNLERKDKKNDAFLPIGLPTSQSTSLNKEMNANAYSDVYASAYMHICLFDPGNFKLKHVLTRHLYTLGTYM